MKVELKDLDKPFTKLRLTKFDDGLIRGGAVGALNASAVDTLRIGKFLTDLPKGPLFLIKQVGLQLSNPRLEAKKGATGFLSGVGPTRIYNLGINTIAQVPLNAFGGHLVRHGLLPVMNDNTKYLSVVSENNKFSEDNLDSQNNRLVGLRNKFDLGDGVTEVSITLKDAIATNRQNNRDGRQANRELNKTGRQANRSLNKMGRKINREDNREIRKFNRDFNRENRKINRAANKQGRQNNRLVNQSTKEGARVEGFEFTRSKFERTSYEPTNLEQTKFERSAFHRSSFKRNKINISDYAIDNYLGGPGSVYGIGRTIINRYNFTEDKIKIDEAFENARIETIRGSLLVDPLTEISEFADASGSYITGATIVPLGNIGISTNEEDNQFKALSRNKQPETFFYVGKINTSKLQKVIGDGKINTDPQSVFWNSDNSFGTSHKPSVNPIVATPSDKFNVIKQSLDFDPKKNQFKYIDEDPTYIGGTRIIKTEQAISTLGTGVVDTRYQGTKTFKGKQADFEKFLKENTADYNQLEGDSLNEYTTGRTVKETPVKASIVNVEGFERENKLEKIYKAGEMVSSPITKIIQVVNNGEENFVTEEITVNRDAKKAFYFNGKNKVSNFDRIDSDIMIIEFDPIDPFSAKEYGNVQFSAYMSGFKYNSNSTWNPVKYVGRSESFYTFTEHKRDVSFNLQIPCFNKTHLLEKHRALSELQSIGAGKYNDSNRLGGIITQVTVGRYLIKEPGILTSVSFDIPDTSSWDVDLELAMYINAQFSFIIIGNKLPQYQVGGFLDAYLPDVEGGYLRGANAR